MTTALLVDKTFVTVLESFVEVPPVPPPVSLFWFFGGSFGAWNLFAPGGLTLYGRGIPDLVKNFLFGAALSRLFCNMSESPASSWK